MAGIMIELPEEFKNLAGRIQDLVDKASRFAAIAKGGKTPDYMTTEVEVADLTAKIEQEVHGVMLSSLDVDVPKISIGKVEYKRVGRGESTYYTMAGPVVVMRTLYQKVGAHSEGSIAPVSERVGIVGDGWLPQTARAMAHQVQMCTSREAKQTSNEMSRMPYHRSSFERVSHLVGDLYVERHAEIEDRMIREFVLPSEATGISVSIDRVSVPMEEPLPKPVGRPKKGAPKKPVARNYRMAYVGTVTLHDSNGDGLHTIRYGRMPNCDPIELCDGMAADVLVMREKNPSLQVSLVADGAVENWNLFEQTITEEVFSAKVVQLLDLMHLIEKLGPAARVLAGSEADGKLLTARWKLNLINRSDAAASILKALESSGLEWTKVGDKEPVHEAITYLRNNLDRVDYAAARRLGIPIGSGNAEATCKSLFEVRLKRPGSRWKNSTGEHIVQLRALALSDRWSQAMTALMQPLAKSIRIAS